MKVLILVLNREESLEEVMEAFAAAGVAGATILDTEGMGRFLAYEVPLFAAFKDFMKGNKPYNKTIFSVIRDESIIPGLRTSLDSVVGGFSNPGTGILFSVPVDWCDGILPEVV